jgi:hypothetical protein
MRYAVVPVPEQAPSCLPGLALMASFRSTAGDDEIAIGSVADRCLLSGVIQTSHFKGVRTVFWSVA